MWGLILFISVAIGVILLRIFTNHNDKKCSMCGKSGLEIISQKEGNHYNTPKTVKDFVRDNKGNIIKTKEKTITVTKVEYISTYKCKFCGHEEQRRITVEK